MIARKRLLAATIGVVVVAMMAGASMYRGKFRGPTDRLEDRVSSFWDAKVAGDLVRAYSYEVASQTGKVDLGSYLRSRSPAVKYLRYKITSTKEEADGAEVEVQVVYTLQYPRSSDITSDTRVHDRWLKVNGAWFRETKTLTTNLLSPN